MLKLLLLLTVVNILICPRTDNFPLNDTQVLIFIVYLTQSGGNCKCLTPISLIATILSGGPGLRQNSKWVTVCPVHIIIISPSRVSCMGFIRDSAKHREANHSLSYVCAVGCCSHRQQSVFFVYFVGCVVGDRPQSIINQWAVSQRMCQQPTKYTLF